MKRLKTWWRAFKCKHNISHSPETESTMIIEDEHYPDMKYYCCEYCGKLTPSETSSYFYRGSYKPVGDRKVVRKYI